MEPQAPRTVIEPAAPSLGSASTALARVFTDRDDHELVQRRLGLLYGVLGAIIFAFFLVGVIGVGVARPTSMVDVHTSLPKLVHGAVMLLLGVAWLICRGPLRPRWLLSVIDIGALVKLMTFVSFAVALAPPELNAAAIEIGPFLLIVMLRAAIVPSPPRWTALVSALAAVPMPIGMYFAARGQGGPRLDPELSRMVFPVMGVAWGVAGAFAAWTISRVVYGLRSEVKNAMRLGQYTLEEKIGEGGMGVVWRASHALLRRPTAVKLLHPERTDSTSIRRFEREVQITSMLTHPNTVAIYDFGHTREGVFYYAMELLDGVTLQDLVEQDGPQPAARVVHVLTQVASALAEAHDVGLVHRDVKPANVFLCERGGMPDFAKVLDFGLVKDQGNPDPTLSTANAIAGTPLYMSPESITHPDQVDGRADLYALGGVAYFLLTGTTPFEGGNLVEVCSHHLHTAPAPPSERLGRPVPEPLERLVLRCLAKRPEDRPEDARAVVAALRGAEEACGAWNPADARAWWQARAKSAAAGASRTTLAHETRADSTGAKWSAHQSAKGRASGA